VLINYNLISIQERDYLYSKGISIDYINISDKIKLKRRRAKKRISHTTSYLKNILKSKAFIFDSIFTGNPINCLQSRLSNKGVVYYKFQCKSDFYLICGDIWHEMLGIYVEESDILIYFNEKIIPDVNINVIKSFQSNTCLQIKPELGILIQQVQFAHHLWNELSFVENLVRSNLINNVGKILILSEPILPIGELFPELSEKLIYLNRESVNSFISTNNILLIGIGDCYIPTHLTERILLCGEQKITFEISEKFKQFFEKYNKIIWVSVKSGGKTIENQIEFLSHFIRSSHNNFDNIGFILDGFNYPLISSQDVKHWLDSRYSEIIENDIAVINLIREECKDIPILDTLGCQLFESIYLSKFVDFYVTHQGTLHHKIAWSNPINGVIHTNRDNMNMERRMRPGEWESEVSLKAHYIPKQFLGNSIRKHKIKSNIKNERAIAYNYSIMKIEAVEWIVSIMKLYI